MTTTLSAPGHIGQAHPSCEDLSVVAGDESSYPPPARGTASPAHPLPLARAPEAPSLPRTGREIRERESEPAIEGCTPPRVRSPPTAPRGAPARTPSLAHDGEGRLRRSPARERVTPAHAGPRCNLVPCPGIIPSIRARRAFLSRRRRRRRRPTRAKERDRAGVARGAAPLYLFLFPHPRPIRPRHVPSTCMARRSECPSEEIFIGWGLCPTYHFPPPQNIRRPRREKKKHADERDK